MDTPHRPGSNRLDTRAPRLRHTRRTAPRRNGTTLDRRPCRPRPRLPHQLTTIPEAGRRKVPRSRRQVMLTIPQNEPDQVIRLAILPRQEQRVPGGRTLALAATNERWCPAHLERLRPVPATQNGTGTTVRPCAHGVPQATTTGPDSTATRSLRRGSPPLACPLSLRQRRRRRQCTPKGTRSA